MENFNDIFTIKSNNIKPTKGRILISEPFLPDYFFGRSVVLLIEHNDDGTFGLVINKTEFKPINDVLTDFPPFDGYLFIGGPVKNESLFFMHSRPDLINDGTQILDNLYWGGNIDDVKELVALNLISSNEIRFFAGYSGWVPDQLENELSKNSWLVSSIKGLDVLNEDPDKLWEKTLHEIGGEYAYWTNFPEDPILN